MLAVEYFCPFLGTNIMLRNFWRKRGPIQACWASDVDDDMSSGHPDKL
jgi:hypothetical protein